MLLPTELDSISKKRVGKWNSIRSNESSDSKVVFALLIKVIILYIGPTRIDIRRPGFELIPK